MNITPEPALPESVRVAVETAANALPTATASDVPTILDPLREAWLEAVEDGEQVDFDAVCGAFPPLTDDIANAAEAQLEATHGDAIRAMPILLTFVDANPTRVLSGLRVLSFEAGRGGDDFETWRSEATTALIWAMKLPEGPIPLRLDLIMDAMEDAFFDGRKAGGITNDPPRAVPHPVYAARVVAAHEAAATRLAETDDLDTLAAEIRADFEVLDGDAWLAVEEVSRAAAVAGDIHAARLRAEQVRGVHSWFVQHADSLAARGKLPVGTMIAADQSRKFLQGVAA